MQFQITSRPRHLRYVFFVDEAYPYEKLLSLVHTNQKLWGGRFNPIVPVKSNTISDRWKEVLKHYDPDFVFYSKEIDPEIIKQLRIFNPCGYYNIDEQPRSEDIQGVDAFYLLSQFHAKSRIILTAETWKIESPLLSFYKTNFGFETSLIHGQNELSKDFDRKIVGVEEFATLLKLIYELKPINQRQLASRNLNTAILRSRDYNSYYKFELVIAKDKTSNTDLLYYWNRILFELQNIMYVTIEELNQLCEDENFGKVLQSFEWTDAILVTSQTLTKEEVQEIINTKLKPIPVRKRLEYGQVVDFPFDVMDAHGQYERKYGETFSVQTINSQQGLLHLPKLSFTNKVEFYRQHWVIDIEIKNLDTNYLNELRFPLTSDTHYIVKGVKGRINSRRNISVIIDNQQTKSDTLEINIPEFSSLIRQLISSPVIDGETRKTKYVHSALHDVSNKLSAFLKTFNYHFSTIDDFFIDKFWVEIFEELSKSKRAIGDSILIEEVMSKCRTMLEKKGIVQLDENGKLAGKKEETFMYEENLELGLKNTLKELCEYRVFLKGFNLKCTKCSSQFWYHINEVKETVSCKGCLDDFLFPIEPRFAYKLNDLIKNNIFKSDGSRDGNLTVIRTLVSINNRSHQSFCYSPQLELYDSYHTNAPCCDLDIICLSDGNLIVGEAKHNSKEFSGNSNKALKSLVEIAKAIRPDKIILTCYEDHDDKLNKAKQGLVHIFNNWEYQPEIEVWQLHESGDSHLGNHRYFYH